MAIVVLKYPSWSSFLPNDKGNATPIEKRKKGKTISTQVMPAKFGLKIWFGGGT